MITKFVRGMYFLKLTMDEILNLIESVSEGFPTYPSNFGTVALGILQCSPMWAENSIIESLVSVWDFTFSSGSVRVTSLKHLPLQTLQQTIIILG